MDDNERPRATFEELNDLVVRASVMAERLEAPDLMGILADAEESLQMYLRLNEPKKK